MVILLVVQKNKNKYFTFHHVLTHRNKKVTLIF